MYSSDQTCFPAQDEASACKITYIYKQILTSSLSTGVHGKTVEIIEQEVSQG